MNIFESLVQRFVNHFGVVIKVMSKKKSGGVVSNVNGRFLLLQRLCAINEN
jgi:hypothetical protein